MTAPTQTQPARPKLPTGLRWSDVWRTTDGKLVQGEREVPVDKNWHIAARLFLCHEPGCTVEEWIPTGGDTEGPQPCCPKHPLRLVESPVDAAERDPVRGARQRLKARIREIGVAYRQRAVDAAAARIDAARAAAEQAAKRTAADMRGHVPSLSASAAVMLAGGVAADRVDPLVLAAVSVALASFGVVLAYIAAYVAQRLQARGRLVGRAGRKARARARLAAVGVLVAGLWLCLAAAVGVQPTFPNGAGLFLTGCLASWTVFRTHWEQLWETRRRLRELARLRAEAAAKRAQEEIDRLGNAPAGNATVVDDDSPEAMGRRMAQRWADIARSDTVPAGFLMRRTWIIPDETRELTIPEGDTIVPIGWEYAIESEPGVLVARFGGASPLVSARDWLASMLGLHPSLVSLVDRPDDQINRGLLSITDRLALGNTVAWKGPGSLRREGGAILAHVGADLGGNDIHEFIEIPGQLTGGLTVGHSGGGKTSGARISLLNDLAAGIFPTLYDPVKSLKDFSEFVGVFPMGCLPEHRDVILRSLHGERERRHQAVSGRTMRDRLGRVRPEPGVFQIGRDGPHIRSYWEEFHANSADKGFLGSYLFLMRVQRDVAMDSEVYTQGGGLQDLGDSVVRGLLNQVRLRLYRMPDNLARLAGYTGDYMPSQLPRVPGACLLVAEGVPPIPLRGAWVTRDDEDGCVYDHLYGPDGQPLLTVPPLPKETRAVFEREGLMDLWRLGEGPNGMTNLIADTTSRATTVTASAPAATGVTLAAADVILAIVAADPGTNSPTIFNHSAWLSPAGGGKAPVPSTVSRAASRLVDEGLLTRVKLGTEYADYRVTDKGNPRAVVALAVLMQGRAGPPTPAEVEQQQELARETAEETA